MDLARRLEWLLSNPGAVDGMRAKAAAHVLANYNWERVTDSYEELYRSLKLDGRRNWDRRMSGEVSS